MPRNVEGSAPAGSTAEAGAPAHEIEITPAMIEAGWRAFYACPDCEDPRLSIDEAVCRIFKAMRRLEGTVPL